MPSFFKWDMPSRFDKAKKKEAQEAAAWIEVCRIVDARDKLTCRACGKRSRLNGVGTLERGHRHHIKYRSAGGKDIPSNLVHLCAWDHNEEHQHRLRIYGNANEALEFWRRAEDDEWYLDRREVAPGIIEKD